MIITTNGVWLNIGNTMVKSQLSPSFGSGIKYLAANNSFIISSEGILARQTPTSNTLTRVRELPLTFDDIIEMNDNYLLINGLGMVNRSASVTSMADDDVLEKTGTYLATKTAIYYNGQVISGTNRQ
jgi:DNA-binding phage protein